MRRVRGEQPLPGATEQLLQATKLAKAAVARTYAEYLSVSVSVSKDGHVRVTKLTMDPKTGQILPEFLDSFQAPADKPVDLAWLVCHWAEGVLLDSRGDRL